MTPKQLPEPDAPPQGGKAGAQPDKTRAVNGPDPVAGRSTKPNAEQVTLLLVALLLAAAIVIAAVILSKNL